MTSPSSPEAPWPVRTVARKVAEWIGRLGEVWVEGQVAQLSRRGGAATVFLTLRDPAADMSVPVTCHRDVADRPGLELTEGARVIVRARPDYYVARGNPPGVWLGRGSAQLGVEGRVVTEEQMRALFGEGRHPDRDALLAAGAPEAATRLGRRLPLLRQSRAVPGAGRHSG